MLEGATSHWHYGEDDTRTTLRIYRQLIHLGLLAIGVELGALGCNLGGKRAAVGESLRILAVEPRAAQGLDCDGGDCGFVPNASLRFKFDRWLIPTTATRQSVSLSTEGTGIGVFLHPDYDVTARILSMRPDSPLAPDTVYILNLAAADDDQYGNGFRSYDGDSLEKASSIAFRTSLRPSELTSNEVEAAPRCTDVLAALARAGCANANCHSGTTARMGLLLDSAEGLKNTAINRVAHQTQTGPDITQHVVSGGRFGAQMPIIDSGRPENSYLIYKMLVSRFLNREMDMNADQGDVFAPTGLTSAQIDDARSWFVAFGAMPPDDVGYPNGVSPLDTVRALQTWIRAGASCP